MSEHVLIIGPGRVGLAVGEALWRTGAVGSITYFGRRPEPPVHPLFVDGDARYVFGLRRPQPGATAVFLAVPDGALGEVVPALAAQGDAPPGAAAFHMASALTTEILGPLHARGYSVGSFHPLLRIGRPVRGAEELPGAWVALSGEPEALAVARRLLGYLGSRPLLIPSVRRPVYHATTRLASDLLAAPLLTAAGALARAGAPPGDALSALIPLARSAIARLEATVSMGGGAEDFLGAGDHGDRLHDRALDPGEAELYGALQRRLLELAGVPDANEAGPESEEAGTHEARQARVAGTRAEPSETS